MSISAVGVAAVAGTALAATSATRSAGMTLAALVLAVTGASWLAGRAAGRVALQAETEARLRAAQLRRRTDRLVTVGQLAGGLAHELGTPLAVIAERARLVAAHAEGDAAVKEHAASIERQTRRMSALIRQLLDFARQQRPTMTPADMRSIVRQAVDRLSAGAGERGIELRTDLPGERVMVTVNAPRLHQALTHLVTNAMQAMPDGGTVTIGLHVERAQPPSGPMQRYACCWVEDRGTGIPDDIISRIFEPFFTTRGLGEGSGLGLAVSYGIIQEHGGWIAVHSRAGQGSRFSVYLPTPGSECQAASSS